MRLGFRKRGIQMIVKMVVVLVAMVFAGATHAQETKTTQTRSFEIISIDGDVLVVREPSGTRELIVPSDFRFNVDGKSLALSDLKPGMKGTATVTKTTISRPVYVTEVRNVVVTETLGGSVIVQGDDGFKMYSQSEIDERGIHVFMDGKPVKLEDMRKGDRITANIVTEGPPQTMSKTEVDVTLAKAAAEGPAKAVASARAAAPPAAAAGDTAILEPAPADTIAAAPADTTAAPASRNSSLLWLGLIIIILIILIVMRRRSKSTS